jgi:predicted nucleic acid-binding protein
MIVVDTSILSLAFRRRRNGAEPAVVKAFRDLVRDDAAVTIPGIVLQELLSGIRNEDQSELLLNAVSGFPLLLATRDDHLLAARVFNECRQSGKSIATIDALIAAQTIARQAVLFTTDTDFVRIAPKIGLELLEVAL